MIGKYINCYYCPWSPPDRLPTENFVVTLLFILLEKCSSESDYKNRNAADACFDSESESSSDPEEYPSPPKKTNKTSKAKVVKKEKSAKKSGTDSSRRKRNAVADLGAESESESSSGEEDLRSAKKAKACNSKAKETKKEKPRKKSGKTGGIVCEDLFGGAAEPALKQQPLWSSLSRRVAGGISRQGTLQADGDVYIDLRVFNVAEIIEVDPRERFDKWSGCLRIRLNHDDPLWESVKKIFKDSNKVFNNIEPTFYAEKKKK